MNLSDPVIPFSIREAVPADDDALAHLARQNVGGGAVAFSTRYHVPPRLAVPPGFEHATTVVAELPELKGLAGSARLRVGTRRVDGELRPVALLGSLVVHPAARRQGIAAAMTGWRIERARTLAGEGVVIFANLQRGNDAAVAGARSWSTMTLGPVRVVPLPMRRRPPSSAGLEVGPIADSELEYVADQLQAHTGTRQFSRNWDAASLRAWLDATPLGVPVHHYVVARRDGRVVAGAGVRDEWQLQSLEVLRMSTPIKVANLMLRAVPKDGVMRNAILDKLWHEVGGETAARSLVGHIRWAWRDRATSVLVDLDERSPELRLVGARPWSPTTSYDVAVSTGELDQQRHIDPVF